MESLYQRNFKVDYYEINEQTWGITSHLTDTDHDIFVSVDLSVPEMIIKNCSFKFNKFPMEQWILIVQKAEK